MNSRQTRVAGSIVVVALVAACSENVDGPTQPKMPVEPVLSRQQEAPLLQSRATQRIPDQYIVVLQDNADPASISSMHAVAPLYTYRNTIRGFASKLTRQQLDRLRSDPSVKYIEPDGVTHALQNVPVNPPTAAAPPAAQASQNNPPSWGLDRIDQRIGLNNNYTYTNTGAGVKVYIVDTGIRYTHQEFDGLALNRAKKGIDIVTPGGTANDCNGHGTHVAGTVGGTTAGVAKGATLYAVRVLDCFGFGTWSGFIAGADWVTYNHLNPSVANASLGGGYVQAANDAVTKSILYGTSWVLAAGNSNVDACTTSPAATPLAITVAASDIGDNKAWFSNFGGCVDLYAPGVNIYSSWSTADNAYNTINGTSMAAPHVAGLAALFLQTKGSATPTEVRDVVVINSQPNFIIGNPGGTPNLLAHKQTGSCAGVGYCTGLLGQTQFPDVGGGWYYFSGMGLQRGYLRGQPGTNFNMELHEWNGAAWILRVNKATASTNETIQFNSSCAFGAANCFKMYKVKSAAGAGSFDFWFDRQ